MTEYNKNFINIQLSLDSVYFYSVRRLLQKAIDKNLGLFHGILLDLGCGEMPYRQYILDKNKSITKYIGVDIRQNKYHLSVKPDMFWDGRKIEIENEKVNTIISTELFEHIQNIEEVLMEIYRILSKDGVLFFTVPFIWPLHETPYDEYRYTPYFLKRILDKTRFNEILIVPLGNYNASLAQIICIWINNKRNDLRLSSIYKIKVFRWIEKNILYFIIKKLLKKDEELNIDYYGEGTMPTGFYVYAKK